MFHSVGNPPCALLSTCGSALRPKPSRTKSVSLRLSPQPAAGRLLRRIATRAYREPRDAIGDPASPPLKDPARRKFDVVAAWSVDRLGRSLADVATFMVDLKGYGVGLYLHAQAVDTTTPGGKALLQMAGVFAEFEREMIRKRVLAGQARARASGVRFGRPTIPADKAAAIVADLKTGVGVVKLAKLHSVGVGTVQKLKAKLAA
jgi:hypothetical protein